MEKKYYFICRDWDEEFVLDSVFYKVSESSDLLDFLKKCASGLKSGSDSSGDYIMTREFQLPDDLSPEVLMQQFRQKLFELCETDQKLSDMIYAMGGDIELSQRYSMNSWPIWRSYEFIRQLDRKRFS